MAFSFNDAQLAFDGPIPPGAIDRRLPDHFTTRRVVRLTNVREKPDATRGRMVKAMLMFAHAGTISESDLKRFGFTAAEIAAHAGDALRQLILENPTFPTIQFGA